MSHVMLDLETLGNSAGCAIVSIGACRFSQEGIDPAAFYTVVELGSDPLGVIDPGTVLWWMGQSEEARAVFKSGARVPMRQALTDLRAWAKGSTYLWCQGANFDAPILEAAFKRMEVSNPWRFYNVRDTRTLYQLAGVEVIRSAGHHNALNDAVDQSQAAIVALNKLGWPE